MFRVGPLQSKHYGTQVIDSDGDVICTVWIGFIDYEHSKVSPREVENGWSADWDGYDHVESIYDLECAQSVADKLNQMIKEN